MAAVRVKACTFKRPFPTEDEARDAVKAIKKKGAMSGYSRMNAYKCTFCEFWHLGHSSKRFA